MESKIDDISLFDDEIEKYIDMFCERYGIDDISKESQNRWNACLIYLRNNLVRPNIHLFKTDTGNGAYYDPEATLHLCDLYITYCYLNDKEVSIIGFSNFTGINQDRIYLWGNSDTDSIETYNYKYNGTMYTVDSNGNTIDKDLYINNNSSSNDSINKTIKLSILHKEIHKKLVEYRQETLSSMLTSGKRNPVGVLAILNHYYSWNMPHVTKEVVAKNLVSREQVQALPTQETAPALPKID